VFTEVLHNVGLSGYRWKHSTQSSLYIQ